MRMLFILSMPRSGSTFLARMLVRHLAITSAEHVEPHLFVSAFGPLSDLETLSAWGGRITAQSAQCFLETTEVGLTGYRTLLAKQIAEVYTNSATDPAAAWFIEKTTRNSLITRELVQAIPDARFVILWRNPLDILASVYATWCEDNWIWNANAVELFTGLERLAALQSAPDPSITTLRYEDLVADPQAQLVRLSEFLGIDAGYWDGAGDDLTGVRFAGPHDPHARDTNNQCAHAGSVAKWRGSVNTRRRRRMALAYLDWIGADRLAAMGYDYAALHAELEGIRARLLPSLAEEARMQALALRRWAAVVAWHGRNESRDFGRHALR